jgi:soluble lytic murein transglycosylase-like protein
MARFTLGLLFAIRLLTPGVAAAHGLAAAVPEGDQSAQQETIATGSGRDGPAQPEDVPTTIADAARRWGVDPQRMLRVAWCESKYLPTATSRGGHRGIFQFDGATWRERAALIGVSADFSAAYDPRANVEVAAATMAAGQWWRWACR